MIGEPILGVRYYYWLLKGSGIQLMVLAAVGLISERTQQDVDLAHLDDIAGCDLSILQARVRRQ